jgi:Ca-activated chloride channel homolog
MSDLKWIMRRGLPVFGLLVMLLVLGCGLLSPTQTVTVSILYGSEKQAWLEPLVEEFNNAKNKTSEGSVIKIEATPMGSIESAEAILEERLQPTVWSPASSIYLPVASAEWRQRYASDLAVGEPSDLVLSPVVIAMWEPMARKLGWPDKPLGWEDIANMSISEEGWSAYDRPEWGSFKFGHTHPNFSNSGVVSVLAENYAGAGKTATLTLEDVNDPAVQEFVAQVESSIIHYGSSTGFFASRMFERGPSYLSAAVMYENLVVEQETKRLSGESQQLPVVAIYPKEGTFWTNNPYVILNASWVSEEQREAAESFEAFLLAEPQQRRAMDYGFRPADVSIALTAPLDTQHGVDPRQPQTLLQVPSADVIQQVLENWREVKKPVDLVLVIDTSGSMSGDKIASARTSLMQFIDLLEDRDRLQVITFSDEINYLMPLDDLGPQRDEVKSRVSGIIEEGDTRLYDAALTAYRDLEASADPKHIRGVVLLSDGRDTASVQTLDQLMASIGESTEEGGNSIKLFTIAFGGDADVSVLKNMAEVTGGKQYSSDPESINQIYAEIATFF